MSSSPFFVLQGNGALTPHFTAVGASTPHQGRKLLIHETTLPLALCYLVAGPFALFLPFVAIVVQTLSA